LRHDFIQGVFFLTLVADLGLQLRSGCLHLSRRGFQRVRRSGDACERGRWCWKVSIPG
jgi:hypothetical protein